MRVVVRHAGQVVLERDFDQDRLHCGLGAECDVRFDPTIRHDQFILYRCGDAVLLANTFQTSGTRVNDRRVHHCLLSPADEIRLGAEDVVVVEGCRRRSIDELASDPELSAAFLYHLEQIAHDHPGLADRRAAMLETDWVDLLNFEVGNPPRTLWPFCARARDPRVRQRIAAEHDAPDPVLEQLAEDPDPDVARIAIPKLSGDPSRFLASPHPQVRAAVAGHPCISLETARRLACDDEPSVRAALCCRVWPPDILELLLADPDPNVALGAAWIVALVDEVPNGTPMTMDHEFAALTLHGIQARGEDQQPFTLHADITLFMIRGETRALRIGIDGTLSQPRRSVRAARRGSCGVLAWKRERYDLR